LLTAVVDNNTWFVIARTITGIGVGADLAIVNTYINEMAPREGRARYTALIFLFSALGAVFGVWLGLWLTTPATPLPLGLPFAIAGPGFEYGWRVMYLIGGLLALIGVLLRFQLPESARWLIARGRLDAAAQIIDMMERRASTRTSLPSVERPAVVRIGSEMLPYSAVLGDPMYLGRALLLFAMWFVAYITVYSFGAGFTMILASLSYPPPEAGLIAAVGTFGFVLCAVVAFAYGEQMERKAWLPVSAVLTLIGGVIVALASRPHRGIECDRFAAHLLRVQPLGPDRLQLDDRELSDSSAQPPGSRWSTASVTWGVGSACCSSRRSSRTLARSLPCS
jgi:MFS family permease